MDTLTRRQHWLSVLAFSPVVELEKRWQTLNLHPQYALLRSTEIGLTRLQARMGGTGKRFVLGDMTITRAVVRLADGTCGYSYVAGRDKTHAERCAVIDALLQLPESHDRLQEHLIKPLAAQRVALCEQRAREIASSKVDFFTLVRGDN
ncbi:phosphonate C-P lyase system protein PhnG [Pectobacterium versatile]|uniref:phosphonate C-P lyase system protein PhnG n=1 Tax=Pectobacterium versatile TaxID=2488639 RepID=UPI001F21D88F|nr:phosphonate C-P lyase system protein PhnG [Pectobacterium versatile]